MSAHLLVALAYCGGTAALQTSGAISATTRPAISPLAEIQASGAISATTQPVSSPLSKLSAAYSRAVTNHYLPMAFTQAAVLASGADVATQLLEHSSTSPKLAFMGTLAAPMQDLLEKMHLVPPAPDPVNLAHVFAMAAVASTMSGAMNAIWLRQLEQAFPGKAAKEVAAKTLIHAVILASIINSAYLVGVPLLTHACEPGGALPPLSDPSAYFAGWTPDEFITLTKLEICMFIPYNTLAFKLVPPAVRPLTHAMVSATFNVAVSAVTLGYFDAWCARAAHLVA